MAKGPLYSITVEDAVGGQTYDNIVEYGWEDLQSTTYLKFVFANGEELLLNDFSVRKVFIKRIE